MEGVGGRGCNGRKWRERERGRRRWRKRREGRESRKGRERREEKRVREGVIPARMDREKWVRERCRKDKRKKKR